MSKDGGFRSSMSKLVLPHIGNERKTIKVNVRRKSLVGLHVRGDGMELPATAAGKLSLSPDVLVPQTMHVEIQTDRRNGSTIIGNRQNS